MTTFSKTLIEGNRFIGVYTNAAEEVFGIRVNLVDGRPDNGIISGPRKVITFDPLRHVGLVRAIRKALKEEVAA